MAITLAAISKIFLRDGDGLRLVSLAELQSLLAAPHTEATRNLSVLYIRRCDLILAIETLKQHRPTTPSRTQAAARG